MWHQSIRWCLNAGYVASALIKGVRVNFNIMHSGAGVYAPSGHSIKSTARWCGSWLQYNLGVNSTESWYHRIHNSSGDSKAPHVYSTHVPRSSVWFGWEYFVANLKCQMEHFPEPLDLFQVSIWVKSPSKLFGTGMDLFKKEKKKIWKENGWMGGTLSHSKQTNHSFHCQLSQ